ncbi:MAG: zf-HC2 domain-containing protein [Myxococcota bacterium]|nr:zf-HC2 domain-containing protein [Myxococcota bacterium]
MECNQAKTHFIGLYDGDLDEDTRLAVEAHLSTCEHCRLEWREYQQMMAEVSGLRPMAPPENFVSRVKQTIEKRSRGRFFGPAAGFNLSFAIISFILILLFLMAYLFISSSRDVELISPETSPPTLPSDAEESSKVTPQ